MYRKIETMKNILENAIKQMIVNRKLFYINLFNGNEKCIQGDLYSELNKSKNVSGSKSLFNEKSSFLALLIAFLTEE